MQQEFACNQCQYYTSNIKFIQKHFNNKYHELKTSENSQEYIIQMSFKIKLWKYIQVNEFDNEIMREDDENDNKEWNKMLEKEFEKSIEWINISKNNEYDNLRLMSAFIIRIKWNIAIKDMNRTILIEMIITSSIKDKLHKIILYERYYIQ